MERIRPAERECEWEVRMARSDKVTIPEPRARGEFENVYATKTGRRYVKPQELLDRSSVQDQLKELRKLEPAQPL